MPTTMGIKLDTETRARLKALSQVTDRSTHWLMKRAIHRFLDAEERYQRDKAEDRARWERYVDTGEALSNEDMGEWFDQLEARAARADRAGE